MTTPGVLVFTFTSERYDVTLHAGVCFVFTSWSVLRFTEKTQEWGGGNKASTLSSHGRTPHVSFHPQSAATTAVRPRCLDDSVREGERGGVRSRTIQEGFEHLGVASCLTVQAAIGWNFCEVWRYRQICDAFKFLGGKRKRATDDRREISVDDYLDALHVKPNTVIRSVLSVTLFNFHVAFQLIPCLLHPNHV